MKTFIGAGVQTCARFRTSFEAHAPCATVKTFVAPVRGLWSAFGDFTPDAGITCKVNGYKKS